MAPGPLKSAAAAATGGAAARRPRKLHITIKRRLEMPELKEHHLHSHFAKHLHIDMKESLALLSVESLGKYRRIQAACLAAKRRMQHSCVLVVLKECGKVRAHAEACSAVGSLGLDVVVVEADPAVGVADADVEGEVVAEGGDVDEAETGQGGRIDVDFELARAVD